MEAMSSADFAPKEEPKDSPSKASQKKFTDALNKLNESQPIGESSGASKAPSKNTFQKMLAESEMKVSVAKKAPKKGMQLGKPKAKKNTLM